MRVVVKAMPRPLYTREWDPMNIVWDDGRALGQVSGRVRKISRSPIFDPRTVEPGASRYTDWPIPDHDVFSAPNQTHKCTWWAKVEVSSRKFLNRQHERQTLRTPPPPTTSSLQLMPFLAPLTCRSGDRGAHWQFDQWLASSAALGI
jgi:hypothetical protein